MKSWQAKKKVCRNPPDKKIYAGNPTADNFWIVRDWNFFYSRKVLVGKDHQAGNWPG
jgi:hypothetical protein